MPSLPTFSLPFVSRKQSSGMLVPHLDLYPDDPFYDTPVGKLLRWAVSAGRHIVIFTEVIVIVSFFSRFTLDRQLTDLNRTIIQKQGIVESYGTLEADVRKVQDQTGDIRTILDQQGRYEVMTIVQEVTPADVVYDQISLRRDRLSLTGTVGSNRSLERFVDRLKSVSQFESVSINSIQSGSAQDPGIVFSLALTYSEGLAEALQED